MQGGTSQLFFLVAAAAMFYVLVIRPQQKRAKQQAEMLTALAPGVEIVTIGGIYGTIVEVGDDRLRLRVADGSELEISRRAVGSVVPPVETTDDADDAESPVLPDAEVDDDAPSTTQE
jgi:preprotein translocase subunit YajC